MHARVITRAILFGSLGFGCSNSASLVTDVLVAVTPDQASVPTQGTVAFTAAVTGTNAGESTAVTWSVQEAGGGTVGPSGPYTAPSAAGTYHPLPSGVAPPSRNQRSTRTE